MNTLKPAVFAVVTALTSAFGPIPDESTIVEAIIGKDGAETPNKAIEDFLVESRRYLDL